MQMLAAKALEQLLIISMHRGFCHASSELLYQVADAARCPVYELPAALLEEFCMDPHMQLYLSTTSSDLLHTQLCHVSI